MDLSMKQVFTADEQHILTAPAYVPSLRRQGPSAARTQRSRRSAPGQPGTGNVVEAVRHAAGHG